jgi:integrase
VTAHGGHAPTYPQRRVDVLGGAVPARWPPAFPEFRDGRPCGKFKELVGLVGPGKALAAYDLAPAPRAANGSSVTVAEWVEHHIEHLIGCERKTIDEYRRLLKGDIAPGLGPIPLMSLTGEHLALWVQGLKAKGNSGKTIRNKHGFVSSALNAAAKSGHIAVNPAAGQRLPRTERKEMVFLSEEEYHLLHGCFSDHYKPFVEFLAATGARFSEATALQPKDIDREAATVRISRAWKRIPGEGYELGPPKTKRSIRTIGVSRRVFDALDLSHEWLFINTADNPCGSTAGAKTFGIRRWSRRNKRGWRRGRASTIFGTPARRG